MDIASRVHCSQVYLTEPVPRVIGRSQSIVPGRHARGSPEPDAGSIREKGSLYCQLSLIIRSYLCSLYTRQQTEQYCLVVQSQNLTPSPLQQWWWWWQQWWWWQRWWQQLQQCQALEQLENSAHATRFCGCQQQFTIAKARFELLQNIVTCLEFTLQAQLFVTT